MKKLKPWSSEWKREQLRTLCGEWADCTRCVLAETRINTVFGNGNPDADIMLIGEGPGAEEDESGDAFVGKSGKLLTDLLEAAGMRREDVFITNLVECRPPENRDPTKDEKVACYPRLVRQIYLIDPLLIIPIGKPAMNWLMKGDWKGIVENHGKLGAIKIPGKHMEISYPAMPILHPAYILREDKINTKTGNWETEGLAHATMLDLIKAKSVVDYLNKKYEPMRKRFAKQSEDRPGRASLRVLQ